MEKKVQFLPLKCRGVKDIENNKIGILVVRAVPPYRPIMQAAWGLTLRRGPRTGGLAQGASRRGPRLIFSFNFKPLFIQVVSH